MESNEEAKFAFKEEQPIVAKKPAKPFVAAKYETTIQKHHKNILCCINQTLEMNI